MSTNKFDLWVKKKECCGCSACASVCPVGAITMKTDEQGFDYPYINFEKCIKCGSCLKVCAFKKDKKSFKAYTQHIYAAKASKAVRMKSSSGGLFTILSEKILENGGAIISAVYDSDSYEVIGELYNDVRNIEKANGSKYIQANMNSVFNKGYYWIRDNTDKKLLFVGTGCQVAGFKEYAKKRKIDGNVITVDLICNGVPSPGLWKKYAHNLEKKIDGKLSYITFKDKRNGWHNPSVYGVIDGREVSIEGFAEWFYGRYSLRESCYSCPYARIDRCSDITIGDYWGIEEYYPDFYDELGVSLAIVHTEVGQELFDSIKDNVDWIEINRTECKQPRLQEAAIKPLQYNQFWRDINSKGIDYCTKKYREKTKCMFFRKVINKICKIHSIVSKFSKGS